MTRKEAIEMMRNSVAKFTAQVAPFYEALDWHPYSENLSTEEGISTLIHKLINYVEIRDTNEVESGGIVVGVKGSLVEGPPPHFTGFISFRHTAHFYNDDLILWRGSGPGWYL